MHLDQLIDVDPNDHFQVLHIPGLTEVLRLHPDFLEQFSEDIQHDLTYNLREGYDPEVVVFQKINLSKLQLIFNILKSNLTQLKPNKGNFLGNFFEKCPRDGVWMRGSASRGLPIGRVTIVTTQILNGQPIFFHSTGIAK